MMKPAKVKNTPATQPSAGMAALWQESMADDDFRFEIKAQSVAVDLVRAISELGMTQVQVAEHLGWKPSRVSRILHAGPNITLRTLFDLATALGLEFDVIYRHAGQRRAPQPWEEHAMLDDVLSRCREIDSMHDKTKANLSQSKAILETARQLNRRAWHAAMVNVPTRPVRELEAA